MLTAVTSDEVQMSSSSNLGLGQGGQQVLTTFSHSFPLGH